MGWHTRDPQLPGCGVGVASLPAGVGVVGVASQPDRDLPDQLDRDLPVVVPGCGVVVGVAKVGFRQRTGSCRFLAHHLPAGIQLTNFPRNEKRAVSVGQKTF